MSERLIPRIIDFQGVGTPGWFCPLRNGKALKPVIRCKCGNVCSLGFHHVRADGTVIASVHHNSEKLFEECSELCPLIISESQKGAKFPEARTL